MGANNAIHRPTTGQRRQAEALASRGVPHVEIARVLGITAPTLRKYYRHELDLGHIKASTEVAGFLFAAAKNGNVLAQIFWLKCRAGWSDH